MMMRNNGHEGTDMYTGSARSDNVKHHLNIKNTTTGACILKVLAQNNYQAKFHVEKRRTSSDWPFYRDC